MNCKQTKKQTKKSVIRIPNLRIGQYLFLLHISYYFKLCLIYKNYLNKKKRFFAKKNMMVNI